MRKILSIIILSVFFPLGIQAAHLADFETLTCEEYLKMGENNTIPILFWIEGYLSAKDGLNNMNEAHMKNTIYDFMNYCGLHRKESVSSALKRISSSSN